MKLDKEARGRISKFLERISDRLKKRVKNPNKPMILLSKYYGRKNSESFQIFFARISRNAPKEFL